MKYLIIYNKQAFYTEWFDAENHFTKGMVVIDRVNDLYTSDGRNWLPITDDHL